GVHLSGRDVVLSSPARPRAADAVQGARGRARRRPSPLQLSRVVERRPGVIPPKPGPPPRQVRRERILFRRGVAVVVIVALIGFGAWLAYAATRGSGSNAPAEVTSVAAPRPFRIIFPEGFTRREMAQRVTAVAAIAEHKRGVPPRISAKTYLA